MACDMNRVTRRDRATKPTRTSEKPTWRRWTGHSDSGAPGAWKTSCNCGMASVVASSNSRSRPAVVLRARGQPGRLLGVLGTMLRSIVKVEPKRNVLVCSDDRTKIRTTETRVSDSGLTAPRHSWACFDAAYLRRGASPVRSGTHNPTTTCPFQIEILGDVISVLELLIEGFSFHIQRTLLLLAGERR